MNRKLITLGILALFILNVPTSVFAAWDKSSGVKKESYDRLVQKNLELKAKIDLLVKDYESFKERYNFLMGKVKSLQNEKEHLLKANRLSKFTTSDNKSEIEKLKKELLKAKEGLSKLKEVPVKKPVEDSKYKQISSKLEKELRASRAEIETKEKELKEFVKSSETALKEHVEREKKELEKKFKADLDAKDTVYRKQDEKIKRLSNEIQELRSAAKKKITEKRESSALKDRVKALQAENAGMRKDLNELEKVYGSKEGDVLSLNNIVQNLKASLDEQGAIRDRQGRKIQALEKELQLAKQKVHSAVKNQKSKEKDIVSLSSDLKAKEAKSKEIAKASDTRYRKLETEKTSLENKLKTQYAINKMKDDKIKSLEKELGITRSDLKTKEAKFKEAAKVSNTQYEKLKAKKSGRGKRLEKDLKAQHAISKAQDDKIKSLEKELEIVRSNFSAREKDLQEQYVISDTQNDKIKSLENELEISNSELKAKDAKSKETAKVSDAEYKKLKAKKAGLEKQFRKDLKMQYGISKAQNDKIKAIKKELESAVEGRIAAQKDLKQSIIALGAEYQKLEIQNKALEKKVKTLEVENRSVTKTLTKVKRMGNEKISELEEDLRMTEGQFQGLNDKRIVAEAKQKDAEVALKKESVIRKAQDKKIKALEKKIQSREKKVKLRETKAEAAKRKKEIKEKRREEKSRAGKLAVKVKELKKKMEDMRSEFEKKIAEPEEKNVRLMAEEKIAKLAQKEAERKAEQAREYADEAMTKANKERLDAHYNIAVVFDRNGMYKKAEGEYLKCLELEPDDASVHYNLGILYDDKLMEKHKASKHYTKFLELRPMGTESLHVRDWLFKIEQEGRLGVEMR